MASPSPSMASPSPRKKAGYLLKYSGDAIRKSWKSHYFELEWPRLQYKKDAEEAEWEGVLLCDDVILTDELEGVDRPHSFCALHKVRAPFFLQAETQQEMMGWVKAIRNDPSSECTPKRTAQFVPLPYPRPHACLCLDPPLSLPCAEVSLIDFDVRETLGEGAYGKVQVVRHRRTGCEYAMKILSKEETREADNVELAKLERDVLKEARHPFVVQMAFAFQTPQKLYMVMDLVEGGDMYEHMKKQQRFSEDVVRVWAAEISLALGYLHSIGIIYRDLKPDNILLDMEGHCRITDFGLSYKVQSADGRAHSFCGTPFYVSPELILQCKKDNKKRGGYSKDVDWWALGVLCFELFVGGPPFDGTFHSPNCASCYLDFSLTIWATTRAARSTQQVYNKIVNQPIGDVVATLQKKANASPPTISFVTGLLERDLAKRLGAGQADVQSVREHPFFEQLDWAALERMEVEPGYKPSPKSPQDKSHAADHFARKTQGAAAIQQPKGIFARARRKSVELILGENVTPGREQMAALLVEDSSEDEFEGFGFRRFLSVDPGVQKSEPPAELVPGTNPCYTCLSNTSNTVTASSSD
jgi:serine/threonine protein kinase